ncbi:MAG: VWA domain-containing protein [Anaerolineae bacterium]|nr:VWA domain-containing protein [Anaerolineae bacterium]
MRKLLIPVLIIAAFLFAVTVVVAQAQGITINGVDDSEFPLLKLLVTVVDAEGRPVIGLTESDFSALAGGRNAEVVRVEEIRNADLPVSVVLVIDSSESMYGAPLQDTTDAANILLDNLRPVDEVAVIDFDSGYRVVQPFTNDFGAARAAVAGVVASGVTSLYDAAYAGVDLAISEASNPRRFVVLVTDGHEYGGLSTHGANDAVQLSNDNGVPFFAIGFGSVYPPYLQNLGNNTGGQTYILPSSGQLSQIFDFISNYLRSQYVVTIQAGVEPDGSPAPVTLRSGTASTTRGYVAPDLYPVPGISGIPADPIAEPTTVNISGVAPRQFGALNVAIDGTPIEVADATVSADNLNFSTSLTIDPLAFAPGTYNLSAEAVDVAGGSRSTSASFTIAELPLLIESTGIVPGETIANETVRTVTVDILQTQTPVNDVIFSVDGIVVQTDTAAPYSADIDLSNLVPGPHLVTVVAHNAQGQETEGTLAFVIPQPPTATPTYTPIPPTNTPVPPSNTPVPPTNTPVPPTNTPVPPTNTPVPPTNTPVPPTDTPVPPTNTPVPPTATITPLAFTISGIELGEEVMDAARAVRVILDEGVQAESVTFALDGAEIDRDIAAPYMTTIDTATLEPGAHVLDVTVTSITGETATEQVPFTVVEQATATPRETAVVVSPSISTATLTATPLSFTITGIELGQEVTEPALTVRVSPAEDVVVESVAFALDGAEIDRDEAAPYITTIDTTVLDPGTHLLDITLTSVTGETTAQQIPFTVAESPTATPRDGAVVVPSSSSTPAPATGTPAGETTTEVAIVNTEVPATETPASPADTPVPASETPMPPASQSFTISGIESGATVDAPLLTVEVQPSEGVETDNVTFALDGSEIAVDAEAPYVVEIETAPLTPGDHILDIGLTEASGETSSTQIPFVIPNPEATAQPQAAALAFSLSGLIEGDVISEDTRTIEVVPADGIEVADVTFAVDGAEIATIAEAPYSATIDTTDLSEGEHSLSVTLRDATDETATQTVNFSVPARTTANNDLLLIGGGALLLLLLVGAWAVVGRRRQA